MKTVLVEYDGPQLAILEDGPDWFLAVAVDQDKDAVRWIQSPLSKSEYQALTRGEVSVRDALLKRKILVLADYTYDQRLLRVWKIIRSLIPEAALPRKNALLPKTLRAALTSTAH
jgi:hypothetical protein